MLLVQYLSTRNILQNFLNFFFPCIHQNTKNCYFFHNSSDFNKNYSWRSASIGFRFAALYEGSIPNMIPIAMEKSTASIAAAGLIAVGVPFSIEITLEIGLKKAIGAGKGAILGQFLTEAVVLTSLGGLVGVLVGVILSEVRSVTDTSMIFMSQTALM